MDPKTVLTSQVLTGDHELFPMYMDVLDSFVPIKALQQIVINYMMNKQPVGDSIHFKNMFGDAWYLVLYEFPDLDHLFESLKQDIVSEIEIYYPSAGSFRLYYDANQTHCCCAHTSYSSGLGPWFLPFRAPELKPDMEPYCLFLLSNGAVFDCFMRPLQTKIVRRF